MSRSSPPFPTSFRLSSSVLPPTPRQIRLSTEFFSPAPILRFTVGKFTQLPTADGPEVAILGRSNVGKSSLLNALFPKAPHNFARVSSKPGRTTTLNGYTVPNRRFTIVDLPGYGYRGRTEWEREVTTMLRSRRELKKAYLLVDSLHGPKDTDIEMLETLAKTGLTHQLVLTKLDRASATLWTEIKTALKENPTRDASYKSAVRTLPGQVPKRSVDELRMGVWAPLRGELGLGCDETILGVSSMEGWGIAALRCSILQACGAFRRGQNEDGDYARMLEQTPIADHDGDSEVEDMEESDLEDEESRPRRPIFADDNPMRGKVFGGEKMLRKKIYRW